jgi:hypothetical protein
MLPNVFKNCIYLLNEIFSSHIMRLLIASGGFAICKSNENAYE